MKPTDCQKLEKNYSFKRSYYIKSNWWANLALVAPICLLFIGLVGIIYSFKNGMLASWYCAPYILVFAIGTLFLKAVRLQLMKKGLAEEGKNIICLAQHIKEEAGYIYCIFVTSTRRHDKSYIANLASSIDVDRICQENKLAIKQSILLKSEDISTEYFIRAFKKKDLTKNNKLWNDRAYFPIIYIDSKYTFIVREKDINRYLL